MQKKQKIKNKYIKLYFVCDINNPYLDPITKIPNVLCVTANKENAKEYIDKRLFVETCNHYAQWCGLRGIKMDGFSWNLYKKITPNPYYFKKHKIDYNSISSLFRLFYGCSPLGCSFDTLIETSAILNSPGEDEEEKGGEA